MKWSGYEFDEAYRPRNYEERTREEINYGVAFYLKGRQIFQDAFEEAAGRIEPDRVYVYCPKNDETFDFQPRRGQKVDGEPCPNEGYCSQCCYLKNAVYEHRGLTRGTDVAFYQRTDRGAVLRVFRYTLDFSGERYDMCRRGEESEMEWLRIFYNTDRSTEIYSRLTKGYSGNGGYFYSVGEKWRKKKDFQDYASFAVCDENLEGTLLEGYCKYAELAEEYIDDGVKRAVLYLALFRTPALKEAIKGGYHEIANESVLSHVSGMKKIGRAAHVGAKTIKRFFGFEPSKLDRLSAKTKSELTLEELRRLRYLIERNIKITEELVKICGNARFYELADMQAPTELRETLKYLSKQRELPAANVLEIITIIFGRRKSSVWKRPSAR